VILWTLPSLEEKNSFSEHTGLITAMTFAPNGKLLACASQDKTITLWDLIKNHEIPTLTGHSDGVTCLAFSPDGKTLASGSLGSFIKLWDVAGRKEIATLKAQHNKGLAFFADGKKLVNGGGEQTLRIWDVETEKELATLRGHSNYVYTLALAPDNKNLASGGQDGTIRFWDMALEKSFYGYKNQIGAWLLACAPLGGGPLGIPPEKYLEPPGPPEIASLTNPLSAPGITSYPYSAIRYSPNGKLLVAACQAGSITFFNTADRKKIPDFLDKDRFPGTIHDVIFDGQGRHLITVNNNGTIYILRLMNGATRPNTGKK
jgi:WD40 repeat protein